MKLKSSSWASMKAKVKVHVLIILKTKVIICQQTFRNPVYNIRFYARYFAYLGGCHCLFVCPFLTNELLVVWHYHVESMRKWFLLLNIFGLCPPLVTIGKLCVGITHLPSGLRQWWAEVTGWCATLLHCLSVCCVVFCLC